jgi:hypothetical protein
MSTKQIVDQIKDKKFENLKETVNQELLSRAIQKLDERKIEVAKKYFDK